VMHHIMGCWPYSLLNLDPCVLVGLHFKSVVYIVNEKLLGNLINAYPTAVQRKEARI